MRKHGGKMYYASTQLIKPEKAGYMPNFEAQDLSRKKINTTEKLVGKITLMTFVYAKFGEVSLFFHSIFLYAYHQRRLISINHSLMSIHSSSHSWKNTEETKIFKFWKSMSKKTF